MKLEEYMLYIIYIHYYNIQNLLWLKSTQWLLEIWWWRLIVKGHKETFWGDKNVMYVYYI